jgi:hypothetical protein
VDDRGVTYDNACSRQLGLEMNFVVGAIVVLILGVLAAVFRVNLWTLTPWSTRMPSRLDDSITTLSNADEKDKK